MQIKPLQVQGAYELSVQAHVDERGLFARTYCEKEFAERGLPVSFVQASTSYNKRCGTLRGLHLQLPPSKECKLVRCTRGKLFDILLDLRPDSGSYLQHCSLVLTAEQRNAVFIPFGVAHGFQTLADATEVYYQMTDFYAPETSTGFRWDDPCFDIQWPEPVSSISDKDKHYPEFDRALFETELSGRLTAGKPDGHSD